MLTIYQSDIKDRLQLMPIITHNSLIYLVDPTEKEISKVTKELSISRDLIYHPLDVNERSRIEQDENALLIVLNLPIACEKGDLTMDIPYRTLPIGIIHARNHLVIVSKEEVPLFQELFSGKYGAFETHMKTRITVLLFEAIAQSYVDFLKLITKRVGQLQLELKRAYRNRELFELIRLNKSLVYFSTSLRSMRIVFIRLSKGKDIKLYKEDERMLHDALVDLEQAVEVTEIRRNSLSNLMDAYAAVVNNNLNSIMKILTTLTIMLMIPTMIGSIFSMNVALPHEEAWGATIVVASLMVVTTSILVYVFYKRKYLRL